MWWIAWVALTFSNGSVPSAEVVPWREGGRHKGRLVGEGGFVTHGISMLCIRGNWGRALGRALHVMLFLETLCERPSAKGKVPTICSGCTCPAQIGGNSSRCPQ